MPCNCDYMSATTKERDLSRTACILDELNGKKEIDKSHWAGYHPLVYGKLHSLDADKLVAEVCFRLQTVDVTKYSLELQMWWRDHLRADNERLQKEIDAIKDEADKQAALSKLTPHERKLLGL